MIVVYNSRVYKSIGRACVVAAQMATLSVLPNEILTMAQLPHQSFQTPELVRPDVQSAAENLLLHYEVEPHEQVRRTSPDFNDQYIISFSVPVAYSQTVFTSQTTISVRLIPQDTFFLS